MNVLFIYAVYGFTGVQMLLWILTLFATKKEKEDIYYWFAHHVLMFACLTVCYFISK